MLAVGLGGLGGPCFSYIRAKRATLEGAACKIIEDVQAVIPTSEPLLLEQLSYYIWPMHSRCRDMMRDAGVVLRGQRRATSHLGHIPARVVVIGVRLCRQQALSTDYNFRMDYV